MLMVNQGLAHSTGGCKKQHSPRTLRRDIFNWMARHGAVQRLFQTHQTLSAPVQRFVFPDPPDPVTSRLASVPTCPGASALQSQPTGVVREKSHASGGQDSTPTRRPCETFTPTG